MKTFTIFVICTVLLSACTHTNVGSAPAAPVSTEVQAHSYRYQQAGSSGPVVVFENGLGDSLGTWEAVQEEVSQYAETFAYNRAGYKGSPPATGARDAITVVSELRALLAQRGLAPPYVLVGHSLGGLYMQYYARNFPDEVAGLVLVDSSHWDQAARMPRPFPTPWGAAFRVIALWGVSGDEADAFEMTQREVRESPPLRTMPLTVISAGLQGELWQELQRELAGQVPGARHTIAEGSGHLVQREQPELVSAAVRDIVVRLRGQ